MNMDEHEPTAGPVDDDALVARLCRTLAAVDPPPPGLQRSAYELLTWRTVDAELAGLLRAGLAHEPVGAE
jgi:hypothetical protein